jgi:hypothetical protein
MGVGKRGFIDKLIAICIDDDDSRLETLRSQSEPEVLRSGSYVKPQFLFQRPSLIASTSYRIPHTAYRIPPTSYLIPSTLDP